MSEYETLQAIRRTTDGSRIRDLFTDGVNIGVRHDAIGEITEYFLMKYIDPFIVLDIVIKWDQAHCKPPLGREQTTQVFNARLKRCVKTALVTIISGL